MQATATDFSIAIILEPYEARQLLAAITAGTVHRNDERREIRLVREALERFVGDES